MKIENFGPYHNIFYVWIISFLLHFINCPHCSLDSPCGTFLIWVSAYYLKVIRLSTCFTPLFKGWASSWHIFQAMVLSVCELLTLLLLSLVWFTTSNSFVPCMFDNTAYSSVFISILFAHVRSCSLVTPVVFLSVAKSLMISSVIIPSLTSFINYSFKRLSCHLYSHSLVLFSTGPSNTQHFHVPLYSIYRIVVI